MAIRTLPRKVEHYCSVVAGNEDHHLLGGFEVQSGGGHDVGGLHVEGFHGAQKDVRCRAFVSIKWPKVIRCYRQ